MYKFNLIALNIVWLFYHHHRRRRLLPLWVRSFDLFRHRRVAGYFILRLIDLRAASRK